MKFEPPARAISITGFMGTGKTSVSEQLAERLGLECVDTDEMIEQRAGMSISEMFARHGEPHFREAETEALREALSAERRVVSTGGGILLRDENVAMLREAGPIVCLEAEPETILERTSADDARPLLRGEGVEPAEAIRRLLEERAPAYARADYHLDTTALSQEQTAEGVAAMLAEDPRACYFTGRPLKVPVEVEGAAYEIVVGEGLLGELGRLCAPAEPGVRAAVVSSDSIASLYADTAVASLAEVGWEVSLLTVPDGEQSKCLAEVGRLYEGMVEAGVDRGGRVFALGGGVVGDLAGFAAATYLRGVELVHLPTSLLAQVDSSIGGKTAVDLPQGKNLVGAFHQPRMVVCDVAALRTLPEAELRCGLAEIIKHACCFDATMFEHLRAHHEQVMALDGPTLEYLVARNCQIKAEVVAQDPLDKGPRAVLNYGHTVGHALERAAGEWDLRHGEAVALGMVGESRVAQWLGVSDADSAARQEQLIAQYGLPTSAEGLDDARAVAALHRDKKIVAGRLRLPLVPEIGRFEIVEDVPLELVERGLRSLCV